jgi:hypothetical protein
MVEHFQYYNNVGGNVLYHIAFGNSTYYYQPDYVEKINVKEK